jgi:hypothetical protein
VFSSFRKNAIQCFHFLINKNILKDNFNEYVDRLGRTLLHLIFQYDLYECLLEDTSNSILLGNINNLLTKDFNGDSPLNYIYIYNALECFKVLCKNSFDPLTLFKIIKSNNEGSSFIEKCVLL